MLEHGLILRILNIGKKLSLSNKSLCILTELIPQVADEWIVEWYGVKGEQEVEKCDEVVLLALEIGVGASM